MIALNQKAQRRGQKIEKLEGYGDMDISCFLMVALSQKWALFVTYGNSEFGRGGTKLVQNWLLSGNSCYFLSYFSDIALS